MTYILTQLKKLEKKFQAKLDTKKDKNET